MNHQLLGDCEEKSDASSTSELFKVWSDILSCHVWTVRYHIANYISTYKLGVSWWAYYVMLMAKINSITDNSHNTPSSNRTFIPECHFFMTDKSLATTDYKVLLKMIALLESIDIFLVSKAILDLFLKFYCTYIQCKSGNMAFLCNDFCSKTLYLCINKSEYSVSSFNSVSKSTSIKTVSRIKPLKPLPTFLSHDTDQTQPHADNMHV